MTTAAYDAFVAQLERAGVAPEAAHRRAAMEYPDAAAERAREAERRENVLEKDEQAYIVRLFREFGFRVHTTSQSRASKVGVGMPDIWFAHRERPIAGWFEVKRAAGGRVSEAQQEFRADCLRCGVTHLLGDRRVAERFLISEGLAYVDAGGALEPIRRSA